mgnify:CR=1 FL=1
MKLDELLSDSVESKYYTPDQFIKAKIDKKCFSIFHINIASLSGHIDELKALLACLGHPFNVLGITETKIRDNQEPLSNIAIDNYSFENIPTSTHFGGAAFYIRNGQDVELRNDLTKSVHSVAETIFGELALDNDKKQARLAMVPPP